LTPGETIVTMLSVYMGLALVLCVIVTLEAVKAASDEIDRLRDRVRELESATSTRAGE